MNPPQQVTSRYVRNLLIKGQNDSFVVASVHRKYHMIDQFELGPYFVASIYAHNGIEQYTVGATPEQAVHRCLEKHGVTFR